MIPNYRTAQGISDLEYLTVETFLFNLTIVFRNLP